MKIVITGGDGFLGTHTKFFFHEKIKEGTVCLQNLSRKDFADDDLAKAALVDADLVLHFAGINRGTDEELEQGNILLSERLRELHARSGSKAHIVFASSTHEERDTAYGRGKKRAGEILLAYGVSEHIPVTVSVLPNLFGEFAKPRYNSAVATFCDDLAAGRESEVNSEGSTQLLYVQEAIARMVNVFVSGHTGKVYVEGVTRSIPDVYALLASFNQTYRSGAFPDTHSPLELQLFNTLHSYLFDVLFPLPLIVRSDDRGDLFEMVRSSRTDQVFYSSTKPGKVRGEHYHTRKMERFCVVSGEGEISVRRLLTHTTRTFRVSGAEPVVIDMPTFCTHNLKNTGETNLLAVFWISEQFNPDEPDTFREPV